MAAMQGTTTTAAPSGSSNIVWSVTRSAPPSRLPARRDLLLRPAASALSSAIASHDRRLSCFVTLRGKASLGGAIQPV
ncbi:hypothetical protein MAPG_01805 [Magnaporthiopsis poae ATCC 64411]|uniref:Uncharacterized protein n=1 Tax=Magnaporthiopsis poae (strain ATCC 64411 / 73-15) TaxID=644358 RepID=A0A0C4DPN4_MAGP6|nr:hypothetical protein MAPG_01805 [Magnaporthiopsis poae ATCC 64411]